ncbi:hypothetical protein KP509_02G068600 [Ceratopteris richardii]|uniref:DUF7138 domain-containing protein n=1 Tax=Ceratopteris richardii TaxID=49495 RepID=A0A8T2V6Q5_CERRI|nr:hypothetical protein KP509_02G068600 [Ceratopteris richardii]KAH7444181.1 hypothetical protein KP509_02G068600 [Ceratopteris richardii]
MENFAAPYPLVFFDGEQEHYVGLVRIRPDFSVKRFQILISQRTGVPHSQLCTVFVCDKIIKGSKKKQRVPINASTNFSAIIDQHNPNVEKDSYFLVSMKRSRKERKGSRKRGPEHGMSNGWEPGNDRPAIEGTGHHRFNVGVDLAALNNASSYQLASNFVDSSRAMDSSTGRITLMNDSKPLLKHAWNRSEAKASMRTGGFSANDHVHFNSPRFAALRPEDQREINWKWEDVFPGVKPFEHWDSHVAFRPFHRVDADYFLPNHDSSFNGFFLDDADANGNAHLVDAYNYNQLMNTTSDASTHPPGQISEFPCFSGPKPSFFFQSTPHIPILGSENEGNEQRNGDFFFDGQSQVQLLSDGDWQKMPSVSADVLDMQDSGLFMNSCKKQETVRSLLYCQLCLECRKKQVTPIPFHWCVEDAVTDGFQGPSPAGPIGRQVKSLHVEAAA